MEQEINYVIARPWEDEDPEYLSIYAHGSEVQRGSIEDAKKMLEYVRWSDNSNEWNIYLVNFEKITFNELSL
jgi:hypothetical protein